MTLDSLRHEPLSRTIVRIQTYINEPHRFRILVPSRNSAYEHFLIAQYHLAKHDFSANKLIESFELLPKISLVVPVYNTPTKWLEACVHSILDQWYENFELILYDDASDQLSTLAAIEKLANRDPRIKLHKGAERLQISKATNRAISFSNGDFIAFMDHDDTIEPFALMEIVRTINAQPSVDLIYSDEDKINPQGKRFGPYFKTDFDEDLLLSNNFISHLTVVRKSVGDSLQWISEGTDGAQDHDFLLRLLDKTRNIVHVPKVLYSWRQYPGSTALSHGEKPYALEAGKKAVEAYASRHGIEGKVENGPWAGAYRLRRTIQKDQLVSIIIPFKDQPKLLEKCVKSIFAKTDYLNYEILLIDNKSEETETRQLVTHLSDQNMVRYLEYPHPFNFSAINNFAASQAKGEYLLFLNNDTEVMNVDWLSEMVSHIQRDEVGVVGANLRYEDNTVQHQGVALGIGGFAGHVFRHFPSDEPRHFSQGLVRQYSAVTGACLLTKKSLFDSIGGFDAENLKIALNDIDYCLEARKLGFRVIYTPYAQLFHYESKSRGYENTPEKIERLHSEVSYLKRKWGALIMNDPFYNQNLTLDREDFSLR